MKAENQSKKRRRVRRYDAEFKAKAIRLVEEGRSVPAVAQALGIDKSLLYAWLRKHKALKGEEARELEQLRKRIAKLEEEIEILKKARELFKQQKKNPDL